MAKHTLMSNSKIKVIIFGTGEYYKRYNNLGMYHIQSKQKSRLFKTLICSECDTAGLYQVA